MKNLLLVVCVSFFTVLTVFGQDAKPLEKQIGLRFSSLRDFSLLYKKDLESGNRLRVRNLNTNLAFKAKTDNQDGQFSFNTGLAIGVEKSKSLTDITDMIFGFEPALYVSYNSNTRSGSSLVISPRLGYVLGLTRKVSEKVTIGVEAIPSIGTDISFTSNTLDDYQLNLNLSANFSTIGVTFMYAL